MNAHLSVRPADASDVDAIFALLELYAPSGIVLKRSREDIAFFIGNFIVAEFEGAICGCAALRDFGGDLLEVRSVVVDPARQGCGVGRALVEFIIADVELNRPHFRLFTLTTTPAFFQRLGFAITEKESFPEKIWSDCSKCAKASRCDEVALVISR